MNPWVGIFVSGLFLSFHATPAVAQGKAEREDFASLASWKEWRPSHRSGDKEFWGHGPEMKLDVSVEIDTNDQVVILKAKATYQELGGDGTFFEAERAEKVYTLSKRDRDAGWRIKGVKPTKSQTESLTDRDHHINKHDFGNAKIMKSVEWQGDTWGGIFGGPDDPWVSITFNQVVVVLERPAKQ